MTAASSERLSRWSQRKFAARRGVALPAEAEDVPAPIRSGDDTQLPARERQAALQPAEAETVPVLPPIESLTFESDFTPFLAKGVSAAITRAALRKLWVSDPVLANLDGLNDYDEDYHLVDSTITVAQTNYKAGKGYLDDIEDKLAQRDDGSDRAIKEPVEAAADSRVLEEKSGDVDADAAPQQMAAGDPQDLLEDDDAA
ncbi:MAG: DUF3306 domain-containing protein [Pseudolabrys sp.]